MDPVTALILALVISGALSYWAYQRSEGWIKTAKEWRHGPPEELRNKVNTKARKDYDAWLKETREKPWAILATIADAVVRLSDWASRQRKESGPADTDRAKEPRPKRSKAARPDPDPQPRPAPEPKTVPLPDGCADCGNPNALLRIGAKPPRKLCTACWNTAPGPAPTAPLPNATPTAPAAPTPPPQPQPATQPATAAGGTMGAVAKAIGEITGLSGVLAGLKMLVGIGAESVATGELLVTNARNGQAANEQLSAQTTAMIRLFEAIEHAYYAGQLEAAAHVPLTAAAEALAAARAANGLAYNAQSEALSQRKASHALLVAAHQSCMAAQTYIKRVHVPKAEVEAATGARSERDFSTT